jgi:hypothetical protein
VGICSFIHLTQRKKWLFASCHNRSFKRGGVANQPVCRVNLFPSSSSSLYSSLNCTRLFFRMRSHLLLFGETRHQKADNVPGFANRGIDGWDREYQCIWTRPVFWSECNRMNVYHHARAIVSSSLPIMQNSIIECRRESYDAFPLLNQ